MHPLFLIGAIAGAFLLGRKTAEADKAGPKGPRPSPIPLPLPDIDDIDIPEIPPGLDIPSTTSGAPTPRQIANAAAWAKLAFTVEVYPQGADKTLLPPPAAAAGIAASPGCRVVAVGSRWWDRAGQVVKNLQAQNALSVANLERALMPAACRGSQGAGAVQLRAEIIERATEEYGPIRNGVRRKRGGARWWMR